MAEQEAHECDHEPKGKLASIAHESDKIIKRFTRLTPEQSARLISAALITVIAVLFIWSLWSSRHDSQDERAMMIRAYEAEAERGRLFYSTERDKDRQHCDTTDERQQKFFGEQRDKDRAVSAAQTQAIEKQTQKLDQVLTVLKAKNGEGD